MDKLLKLHERKLIRYLYRLQNKNLNTYQLIKEARKREQEFRRMDNKQFYRIIHRFDIFGYVELDKEKRIVLTETGKQFIEEWLSSANII